MPLNQRKQMRQQARMIRAQGETVIFLTPADAAAPALVNGVPLSITQAQAPQPLADYTQTPMYVKVTRKPSTVSFDEGGRTTYTEADIEVPFDAKNLIQSSVAVQLNDGSVLRKESVTLSEDQTHFVMRVQGAYKVAQ